MSLRRLLLWVVPLAVLAAAGYSAWLVWTVNKDVSTEVAQAKAVKAAMESRDPARITSATTQLRVTADRVAGRTGGAWWGLLAQAPVVGDDLRGVRTVTQTLDDLSHQGIPQLAALVPRLHGLVQNGGVNLTLLQSVAGPVSQGATDFRSAADRLDSVDSSGFVGRLRSKFDDARTQVDDLSSALDAGDRALGVLPAALGANGPRTYLMVFQNNAEIRATGGLPGSWAVIRAQGGRLTITRQGAGGPLLSPRPIAPVSTAEQTLFGPQLAGFFVDANVTADFPRAAGLWETWIREREHVRVDGTIALDTWGLSHLLEATGPITVGGVSLTAQNAVDELLSTTYSRLPTNAQEDAFFQAVARTVFAALTSPAVDPLDLSRAVSAAAGRGRFEAHFDEPALQRLVGGSRIAGERPGVVGNRPQVDVTLNDATGAKMSYYLRTQAAVTSAVCRAGRQTLTGTMTLREDLDPAQVKALPEYVSGGGHYGTEPGNQLVLVRIFSPTGGVLTDVKLNGRPYLVDPQVVDQERDAGEVVVWLPPGGVNRISWTMLTGPAQGGPVDVHLTPGMEDRVNDWTVSSSCG